MKIVQEVSLVSVGSFEESSDWSIIRAEIREAISLIVYPPGTSRFTINPTRHGNGVKPIKEACMIALGACEKIRYQSIGNNSYIPFW